MLKFAANARRLSRQGGSYCVWRATCVSSGTRDAAAIEILVGDAVMPITETVEVYLHNKKRPPSDKVNQINTQNLNRLARFPLPPYDDP
jgi:hypothetical protein